MKLESRDKKTLMIGGAVAAVILLYSVVYHPLAEGLSRKRNQIPRKEEQLADILKILKIIPSKIDVAFATCYKSNRGID